MITENLGISQNPPSVLTVTALGSNALSKLHPGSPQAQPILSRQQILTSSRAGGAGHATSHFTRQASEADLSGMIHNKRKHGGVAQSAAQKYTKQQQSKGIELIVTIHEVKIGVPSSINLIMMCTHNEERYSVERKRRVDSQTQVANFCD